MFEVRKTKEEKTMSLTEILFLCRGWTSNIFSRAAMTDSEKWLLSEIGASNKKLCKMKNASFVLNLRKRKLHVKISPDLHDFCGHLKLSC